MGDYAADIERLRGRARHAQTVAAYHSAASREYLACAALECDDVAAEYRAIALGHQRQAALYCGVARDYVRIVIMMENLCVEVGY